MISRTHCSGKLKPMFFHPIGEVSLICFDSMFRVCFSVRKLYEMPGGLAHINVRTVVFEKSADLGVSVSRE